ncbi:uroporphyrinogen-III synthase [Bacillus sp. FJAT-45037]|uniref:uroporphyrinogen-III synthase n=1 Tax=Bacillus sp. FJAT-45037 TaxID=2011007 RepID=UPI0012FE0876|nr:uroporphyrinogen-III synthase [Bacillus sp. FJAT-45037]
MGKRILVTRAKEQAPPLSKRIEQKGGIPYEIPLLSFQVVQDDQYIQQAVDELEEYQWIVFTSANGVHFFMEALKKAGNKTMGHQQIAVVGQKTARVLKAFGYSADLLPNEFVAEDLVRVLGENVTIGGKILLPRGNLGRIYLPKTLTEQGFQVNDLTVYETVCPKEAKRQLQSFLETGQRLDVVTFTSSSAVKHYVELISELACKDEVSASHIACIGPIAKKTAQEYDLEVDITAHTYTIEGLVEAMSSHFKEDHQI